MTTDDTDTPRPRAKDLLRDGTLDSKHKRRFRAIDRINARADRRSVGNSARLWAHFDLDDPFGPPPRRVERRVDLSRGVYAQGRFAVIDRAKASQKAVKQQSSSGATSEGQALINKLKAQNERARQAKKSAKPPAKRPAPASAKRPAPASAKRPALASANKPVVAGRQPGDKPVLKTPPPARAVRSSNGRIRMQRPVATTRTEVVTPAPTASKTPTPAKAGTPSPAAPAPQRPHKPASSMSLDDMFGQASAQPRVRIGKSKQNPPDVANKIDANE